ncbi:hypothetical protein IAR55_001729 [Kwoniella newhampshirensis]|uniref:histidine kinase n=1 Tax=Kwoniella newhampshirensis TaxID=1651941 RepID=A0AAW0Z383_9TREE
MSAPNSQRIPPSSAAFLHHLHTDPSSHHITLSVNNNAHGTGTSSSPRSMTAPLHSPVLESSRANSLPDRTHSPISAQLAQPTAGPLSLGRASSGSRRGRPKTAPGVKEPVLAVSPSKDHEELANLAESEDSCIAAFAREEAGLSDAMDMLSVAITDEHPKSLVLGKSGSLISEPHEQATSPSQPPPPSMSWSTFSHAYAHGLFDPNKIPNPPSGGDSPSEFHSAHSSPGKKHASSLPLHGLEDSSEGYSSKSSENSAATTVSSAPSTSAASVPRAAPSLAARRKAFELEHLPNRFQPPRPDKLALPSYSLAAATVRMASGSLRDHDFAPLSMPSPERELTDPMSGVVSSGSDAMRDSASSDPGTSRYSLHRSMSSAPGTNAYGLKLPTIQASPVTTPTEQLKPSPSVRHGVVPHSKIPPASAPIEKTVEVESTGDYFGTASPRDTGSSAVSSASAADSTPMNASKTPEPKSSPPWTESLPALAYPQDVGALFEKVGWLAAPVPPDEVARRRALYRFNILHTASDLNFDRIAHMAKLVFNPKIVLIALIDSDTQWHKVQTEGHNIGSLCIIDDKPRAEFPPRSRLILKEFAAVAMREMELWRDKTSMEKFTRECLEMDANSSVSNAEAAARMDQVYTRAASLVRSTLDLDGCFILDIGQIEMTQVETPQGRQTVYRADPYGQDQASPVLERSDSFGPVPAFPVLAATPATVSSRALNGYEHEKFAEFLRDHRDGRIFEMVAPLWIRYMFPQGFRYGMVVPVYGLDQQPFAMICAYTTNKAKQFLEGYELQFLRAIGVIILSAVLRRRMVLADKTKSILISSVSHELRTPLHGILAAAELLSDTELDSNQLSFLKTVQTCGNSLIETVNHVLDFTKLSGSGTSNQSAVKTGKVNLAALVEETVEGCWIGQRARSFMGDADIGSFYAPPSSTGLIPKSQRATVGEKLSQVETIIDIDRREKGWNVRCEKGGLRRVLMNLVGNSFKFTKDGYVQVTLREMPHDPSSKTIPVEMTVIDTGKGIGKDFLKEQLFHPFSQENPLQTGTGLGLAIVNSIVRSDSVNGKVDVWSAEGMGTEIKVSFEVEVLEADEETSSNQSTGTHSAQNTSVSFLGFNPEHQGHRLSREVLSRYASQMQFDIKGQADIVVINEDEQIFNEYKRGKKPIIFIVAVRSFDANHIAESVNRNGGFCQVLYKPVTPSGFSHALSAAVDWIEGADDDRSSPNRPAISRGSSGASQESASTISELSSNRFTPQQYDQRLPLQRRRSEENEQVATRPSMAPRGITYHAPRRVPSTASDGTAQSSPQQGSGSPTSTISTISLADGGVMLKAATVPVDTPRRGRVGRVMVVEDNMINRRVLAAFLKKKGFEHAEAVDGQAGVEMFESTPTNYWDVILMDISMPVMNGHQATREIRKIEAARRHNPLEIPIVPPPGRPVSLPPTKVVQARVKIFALTGLATQDDKREAFGSGVDGYLVKPVSLSSLDVIFKKIGF